MTSRRGIARFRAATGAAGIYWRECTLPHFKCALTCARRTAGSFCFRSLLRASSGCDCGVGASTECVRGQFDTTNVTDLLWCSGTSPPAERPKAIKEAVTSLAGTARSMRFKFPRSTRVLKPGLYAKAGYCGLRCITRYHTIPLIRPPSSTSENHTPNRTSGPNFHHHISSYLALMMRLFLGGTTLGPK